MIVILDPENLWTIFFGLIEFDETAGGKQPEGVSPKAPMKTGETQGTSGGGQSIKRKNGFF